MYLYLIKTKFIKINVLNDPSNHPSNFATKNGIS